MTELRLPLRWLWLLVLAAACLPLRAEVRASVNVGGGPQPSGHQSHRTAGVDVNFWQFRRSPRQEMSIGASYTYINSSRGPEDVLHIVSIYPQLTLTPVSNDFLQGMLPPGAQPYFFVRALGPSYMSRDTLGRREQRHASFQAQVGVGVKLAARQGRRYHLTVAWKHFSNANIFADNDGIDLPLVVSLGVRW